MNFPPREHWLLILAFLVIAPTGHGESVTARAVSAENSRFSQGLLWKIEKPGVKPSHVFGTIHVDDDRVLTLPADIKTAFDRSQVFAAELVNDEPSTRKFFSAMVTREPQLPSLLGDPAYAQVDELLSGYGIPNDARPRFKPWAAMLTLLQPRAATGLILDRKLLVEAEQQGKKIHGIESIEEQIAVFDQMPRETQLALLREVIAHHDAIQATVSPAVEAYLARDLWKLWTLNAETMADDAANQVHNEVFMNRVLYDRNERMAQRLAPLLDKGGLFAAFGALHLYGDRGVLSLLERRGYKIQKVY